jgi:hypothetical protein
MSSDLQQQNSNIMKRRFHGNLYLFFIVISLALSDRSLISGALVLAVYWQLPNFISVD